MRSTSACWPRLILVRPLRFDAKGITRLLSPETKARLRALIQLMRWSGLAIQDAVKIRKADIIHEKAKGLYRVVTKRQKTGTHVSVPIPTEVAKEILADTVTKPGVRLLEWQEQESGASDHVGKPVCAPTV